MYDSNTGTLKEFCRSFTNLKAGDFPAAGLKELSKGTWYDWFCRDTSLPNKTKSLGTKVCIIGRSRRIDSDKTYVFFKNNCPMAGSLYDDFRICDRKTGNVLFTVVPSSGFKKDGGKALVWGKANDFKAPLVSGTWADVKKFFGV